MRWARKLRLRVRSLLRSRVVVLGPERQGSQTLLVVSDWRAELASDGETR
jgi:hypothetical protein